MMTALPGLGSCLNVGGNGYVHQVTVFSARNVSSSTVPASAEEIWQRITDPATLADLTPLIRSIQPADSHWIWALNPIAALGLNIDAVFTERMEFTEGRQIVFTHDPPPGSKELAGLEGVYDLTPVSGDATHLAVDLLLSIDVPLPSLSRRAVERVLLSTMRATGRMFASNLYQHLGLDPSTVEINEAKLR